VVVFSVKFLLLGFALCHGVAIASGDPLISCSVEYLHLGGRKATMLKAEGRRQKAEWNIGLKGESFLIADYPDMI
ncbi:MAG: hypothetical protein F6K17_13570, partial [Okeania sp. SIO3C4]|nr:hypothetical protein [Okeania sp. SIO3C4]